MRWLSFLLFIAAVAGGVALLRKQRQVVSVDSPVDRVYAFPKKRHRSVGLGSHLGTAPQPITGPGRTDGDNLHLKTGTHTFFRQVSVARCSAGQYAISFWSHDDVSWKPPKGSATQGPIVVVTADGTSGTVALRASYAIIDTPDQLWKVGTPDALAERAIADTLEATRDCIGSHSLIDVATVGREGLHDELFDRLNAKLGRRGLVLRDLWLGQIGLDPEVLRGLRDLALARTNAQTTAINTQAKAIAYRSLAEIVDDRLLALIRAERSGGSTVAYPMLGSIDNDRRPGLEQ